MPEPPAPTNIGPRGRLQRRGLAVAMALATGIGFWVLETREAPREARLLLAIPLFVGALGWFQAAAGT